MARDRASPPNPAPAPGGGQPNAEDRLLVQRVLSGDPAALGPFQARMVCVPRFVRLLNARAGSVLGSADLEDLIQDVLVTVWRRLDSYRGDAALETWVFRVCDLLQRNAARKAASRRMAPLEAAAATPEPGDCDIKYDAEELYAGLEAIGPEAAEVLRLKHFGGLTFDEIGTSLGNSPNTIKTRYYRAMDSLRRWLRAREAES